MFSKLTDKILAPHRHHDGTEHNHSALSDDKTHTHTEISTPAPTSTAVLPTTTISTPAPTSTNVLPSTTQPIIKTEFIQTAEGIIEKETIIKPAIVEEVVRVDTVTEIQPIVHRDIDQPIINHIDQHVVEPKAAFVGGTVTNKPIIDEHINTRVVEEVQPIVHREVAVPKVVKTEEHLHENIVAPTVHTNDVTHVKGLATEITHNKDAIVKPAIVEEKVRTDKVIEVQPILHRDVEKTIVNHVEQHVVEPAAPFVGGVIKNQAIVEEKVHTHAVDEIQPIVHREVAVQKVEKVEEHLKENTRLPTQHTHSVAEKMGRMEEMQHDKNAIVKPAIVDEKVRTDIVTEVQPIVHREITQPVVNHIEEHVKEPAAPFVGGEVRNAAIIDEHIKTKVVDEIQPVVHREVAVPKIEKREEHIAEHLVAPTQHTHVEKELAGHVADMKISENAIVKPEIVEETVRKDKLVEVQPIVHREVDQKIVNHVEEHVVEPAAPNVGGKIVNKPMVDEHINTQIVNEIQPIVHREIAVPSVEKVEEHKVEHIVAPTEHTHEVKEKVIAAKTVPIVEEKKITVEKTIPVVTEKKIVEEKTVPVVVGEKVVPVMEKEMKHTAAM